MIIDNEYCKIKLTNGIHRPASIDGSCKYWQPVIKYKCDNCYKEEIINADIFKYRLRLIEKEWCGQCARPKMSAIAQRLGCYNEDGTLKPNSGRYTTERVNNMNKDEYAYYCGQRQQAARGFHDRLKADDTLYESHFKKIFKNSKIGYISKGQREIHSILKSYGFELEQNINGLNCDIVSKERKIIIEFHGDFFHANPRMYDKDHFLPLLDMTAGEKWKKDRAKNFKLRSFGYQVIVIWENKWKHDRQAVIDMLQSLIEVDFRLAEWWKFEDVKAKKMHNLTLDKNKCVPCDQVDQYKLNGWKSGYISRK